MNPALPVSRVDTTVSGLLDQSCGATLSRWLVCLWAVPADGTGSGSVICEAQVTVANPAAGWPGRDLSAVDIDSHELGQAVFTGRFRRPEFVAVAGDDPGPVALVDTFEVAPDWRGPVSTPVAGLRVLEVFARLGIGSAALCAGPILPEDSTLDETDQSRVANRIAAMWRRAGFTPIATPNTDGLDNPTLGRPLSPTTVRQQMRTLSGHDPRLRALAGLD